MTRNSRNGGALSNGTDIDSALQSLQDDINKACGEDVAMRLDCQDTLSRVDHWVSTRSLIVDSVLRGGRPAGASLVPFGRQMEISGPESSGKTTLCAQIAAETQAKGGVVLVTDSEERIDHAYWTALGVDTHRIVRLNADSLENAFNLQYEAILRARNHPVLADKLILLIWDSLGGTQSTDIDVDNNGKETPMEQAEKFAMRRAAKISQGMELINKVISESRACYLYTNHEYTKVGVTYGSNRETRGGMKPKYYATVRIQLTPIGQISEGDQGNSQVIGNRVRVKALKNSMAGILYTRDAVVMAGRGFVNEYTVFDVAKSNRIITTAGSWSTWIAPSGAEVKFQGFHGFETVVVPHPEYQALVDNVVAVL